jgi:hypothetical protein
MSWDDLEAGLGTGYGYKCCGGTVKRIMAKLGYHKRVSRHEFNVRPENQRKRPHKLIFIERLTAGNVYFGLTNRVFPPKGFIVDHELFVRQKKNIIQIV